MSQRLTNKANGRNRNAPDPSVPKKGTPAVITAVEAENAMVVRLTFDTRVMPRGVPAYTAGAGGDESPISMTQVSDTQVEVRFPAAVDNTTLKIPDADPALRTPTGGFVPAGLYEIPAAA